MQAKLSTNERSKDLRVRQSRKKVLEKFSCDEKQAFDNRGAFGKNLVLLKDHKPTGNNQLIKDNSTS